MSPTALRLLSVLLCLVLAACVPMRRGSRGGGGGGVSQPGEDPDDDDVGDDDDGADRAYRGATQGFVFLPEFEIELPCSGDALITTDSGGDGDAAISCFVEGLLECEFTLRGVAFYDEDSVLADGLCEQQGQLMELSSVPVTLWSDGTDSLGGELTAEGGSFFVEVSWSAELD